MMDLLYESAFLAMYQLIVMYHGDKRITNTSLYVVFLAWLLSFFLELVIMISRNVRMFR